MPDQIRLIGTGGMVATDVTTDGTVPLNLDIPTGNVALGRVERVEFARGGSIYQYPVNAPVTFAQGQTVNITFTFAPQPPRAPWTAEGRREAREKAEGLLRSFLDRSQRRTLQKERAFWVKGPLSGQRYRINVDDMDCWLDHLGGDCLQHLCIVPRSGFAGSDYPAGDVALAKLLLILTDERRFRQTAIPVVPLPDC